MVTASLAWSRAPGPGLACLPARSRAPPVPSGTRPAPMAPCPCPSPLTCPTAPLPSPSPASFAVVSGGVAARAMRRDAALRKSVSGDLPYASLPCPSLPFFSLMPSQLHTLLVRVCVDTISSHLCFRMCRTPCRLSCCDCLFGDGLHRVCPCGW